MPHPLFALRLPALCSPRTPPSVRQLGFDKAVETCKARMARYQVVPNMLIVPPQLLLYMAVAPEEKIKYNDAGPKGPSEFDSGVSGFEARAFRGCGIFTSTPVRSPSTLCRLCASF